MGNGVSKLTFARLYKSDPPVPFFKRALQYNNYSSVDSRFSLFHAFNFLCFLKSFFFLKFGVMVFAEYRRISEN